MASLYKKIEAILPPPSPHMVGDGFRVHNFFPHSDKIGMKGMSPFFLLDYNSLVTLPPSEKQKGVGVHPHRGFETVTIAYKGSVSHHDSAGNSGVINPGDVQWMTAGSGVLHKEYHEKEFSLRGGPFQMVQLWVNLPARFKMNEPRYQPIENKDMPRLPVTNGKGTVELIAGELEGKKGSAKTFSPVNLFNCRMKTGDVEVLSISDKFNTGLLVIEGGIKLNDSVNVQVDNFVLFGHEGEEIRLEALSDSVILILGGEPIDEPIAAYGPFLMNTQAEIAQAFDDYYSGVFGYLED
ncbi:MAG: pirin family protein [Bacteroidales bacterium]